MTEKSKKYKRRLAYSHGALTSHLSHYNSHYWLRLQKLARAHPYMAQLLNHFPALIFALSSDYGTKRQRTKTTQMIIEGQSLKKICHYYRLPLWMKHIPPAALTFRFKNLPSTENFTKQIVNLIPKERKAINAWLYRTLQAYDHGGEAFSLWLAKQAPLPAPSSHVIDPMIFLAIWSYMSRSGLIEEEKLLWHKEIAFSKAVSRAHDWFHNLFSKACLEKITLKEPWLKDSSFEGLNFKPLKTYDDFYKYGQIFSNCLGQYGPHIYLENCRLFIVSQGATPLAIIRLDQFGKNTANKPRLKRTQILGACNQKTSEKIEAIAAQWLQSVIGPQKLYKLQKPQTEQAILKAFHRQLQPYQEFYPSCDFFSQVKKLDDLILLDDMLGLLEDWLDGEDDLSD